MYWREADGRWVLSRVERERTEPRCPTCNDYIDITQADYGGVEGVICVQCSRCGFLDTVSAVANLPVDWYDPYMSEIRRLADCINDVAMVNDKCPTPEGTNLVAMLTETLDLTVEANDTNGEGFVDVTDESYFPQQQLESISARSAVDDLLQETEDDKRTRLAMSDLARQRA